MRRNINKSKLTITISVILAAFFIGMSMSSALADDISSISEEELSLEEKQKIKEELEAEESCSLCSAQSSALELELSPYAQQIRDETGLEINEINDHFAMVKSLSSEKKIELSNFLASKIESEAASLKAEERSNALQISSDLRSKAIPAFSAESEKEVGVVISLGTMTAGAVVAGGMQQSTTGSSSQSTSSSTTGTGDCEQNCESSKSNCEADALAEISGNYPGWEPGWELSGQDIFAIWLAAMTVMMMVSGNYFAGLFFGLAFEDFVDVMQQADQDYQDALDNCDSNFDDCMEGCGGEGASSASTSVGITNIQSVQVAQSVAIAQPTALSVEVAASVQTTEISMSQPVGTTQQPSATDI